MFYKGGSETILPYLPPFKVYRQLGVQLHGPIHADGPIRTPVSSPKKKEKNSSELVFKYMVLIFFILQLRCYYLFQEPLQLFLFFVFSPNSTPHALILPLLLSGQYKGSHPNGRIHAECIELKNL